MAASRISASLFCVAGLLGGCGGGDGAQEGVALPAGCSEVAAPSPKHVDLARPTRRLNGPATAVVKTSCGSFEIKLDTARAPKTTASFAHLVEHGVYNDTAFHRIIPGFLVQGGDPEETGTGGPGYFVDEPPPPDLSYTEGIVAMAKSPVEPPGRSGSQFFVVTVADAGLSPDSALLGRVGSGMNVVDRIEELGTKSGTPKAPVLIERVSLRRG